MSKDFLSKITCKHGVFNILKNDSYICKSLLEYGEWSELEINLFKDIIKINDIIIEIGSHIGSHTVPLAKIVKEAKKIRKDHPHIEWKNALKEAGVHLRNAVKPVVHVAKKSAKKQSQTVTGRKRKYKPDGSWYWVYPIK